VDAAEGLAADEPLQGLEAEGEFAPGQRALGAQAAGAQALEVRGEQVLRAVDQTEVFGAAALDRGLNQAARRAR
jgi:hypothetical protein